MATSITECIQKLMETTCKQFGTHGACIQKQFTSSMNLQFPLSVKLMITLEMLMIDVAVDYN